jgi:hypothetical protein
MLLCSFVRWNWILFCLKCSRSREKFVKIICSNHYFISHIVHYQSSFISHNFTLFITYAQASMSLSALKRNENKDHLILWSENNATNDATQTQKDFKKWWRFTKYEMNDLNATKKDKRCMCWKSASRSNEVWKCYVETTICINEDSRLLCRRCDFNIVHSTSMNFENNSLKNHLFNKQCSKTTRMIYSNMNIQAALQKIRSLILANFYNESV